MKNRTLNFPRKEYDRVRKMDHNTLAQYIQGKYQSGYADGAQKMSEQMIDAIRGIPGIGPKKMEQILSCVAVVKDNA